MRIHMWFQSKVWNNLPIRREKSFSSNIARCLLTLPEFMYDKEMEFLKNNAQTDLQQSRIGNSNAKNDDFYRSSKQSWIIDKSFEVFNWTKKNSNQKLFYIHDKNDPQNIYNLPLISLRHSVWKSPKMSHLNFIIFNQFLACLVALFDRKLRAKLTLLA